MHNYGVAQKANKTVLTFESNFSQQDLQLLAEILTDPKIQYDIVFNLETMGKLDTATLNTILALKSVYRLQGGNIEFIGADHQSLKQLGL